MPELKKKKVELTAEEKTLKAQLKLEKKDAHKRKKILVTKLEHENEIAHNKEGILKALLEHGELTREEIADYTGLNKEYGPWAAVKESVDALIEEKLIEPCTTDGCMQRRRKRERVRWQLKKDQIKVKDDPNVKSKYTLPEKPGKKPDVWIIKRDISTIRTIFNNYRTLRDGLWKLDWVRDLVVGYQFDTRGLDDKGCDELKRMLQLSRHFFELGVNYSDLHVLTLEWKYYLDPKIGKSSIEHAYEFNDKTDLGLLSIASYRNLFAFCYFMDEFRSDSTPGGYKIVDRYSRQRLHGMIESRHNEILTGIENVMIPTLNGIFGIISDEAFALLNFKNPDGMKTIRENVMQHTALSKQIKRTRKDPDWQKKVDLYRDEQQQIFLEILDGLKDMRIIKRYP